VRRWAYVIAGCESREQAQELAQRLGGDAEPGGGLVYERPAASPFALFSNTVFGGLGGTGTPI
jgi:hypothetical protein